jgi:DNA invertase Pin-like site-specific DNA recombinase/ribosomal protein L37AE/L43A
VTDTLGYVRVSTEQQAGEQKTSLAEQRRTITELARRLGRVLEAESIYEDAGYSGATAEGRPAFMALFRHCESNTRPASNPGMILMLNDSRFGRFDDPEEAGHWRFVLKQLGWHVRFAEADEVQDPLGRSIVRVVHSSIASQYRANLKVRAKAAARSTAALGLWQQEAPFGYRRLATRRDGAQRVLEIGQRKAEDEVSRLTLGPDEEQRAVRWMFEQYAHGGVSLNVLAIEMVKRFSARAWSKQVCRAMIHNPAYVGDVVWCRRVTDKAERQIQRVRKPEEWVVVRDAHPAIVSRATFDTVQERARSNKRQTTATQGGYPLAGIIRCKQCGNHYAGGGGKKGPPEDIDRFRFYVDTGNKKRIPECPPPMMTLRKRWLEDRVIEVVSEFVARRETQDVIRSEMSALMRRAKTGNSDQRAQLERDRQQLVKQRKRLVDAIGAGTLTEAEAATNLVEVRSRLASIDAEIERLRFANRATIGMGQEIERLVQLAQDFPKTVKRLEGAALREVIAPWIRYARVDKQRRVLEMSLWAIPAADRVLRLGNSRALGTQEKALVSRLTARRTIKLPGTPSQFLTWYNRNRPRKVSV